MFGSGDEVDAVDQLSANSPEEEDDPTVDSEDEDDGHTAAGLGASQAPLLDAAHAFGASQLSAGGPVPGMQAGPTLKRCNLPKVQIMFLHMWQSASVTVDGKLP